MTRCWFLYRICRCPYSPCLGWRQSSRICYEGNVYTNSQFNSKHKRTNGQINSKQK